MRAELESLQLPFSAPVPRGHEVLFATVRPAQGSRERASLVLDRTCGCLYCAEQLWGALSADPRSLTDPLAVLSERSWVVDRTLAGRSLGAIVLSEGAARRTRLFVEPSVAPPYR